MTFVKGNSGNPHGRPPNSRALTALLEAAGNTTVDVDGKRTARKRIVAAGLWEGVTEGTITLPGGKVLQLEPGDYLALAKWLYSHIDGPPKSTLEVSGPDGGPIQYDDYRTHLQQRLRPPPAGGDETSLPE